MPEHRNFKAWIYCDGEVLEEYDGAQDPEDERIYNCWVISEAGKQFSVHWESFMKALCDNKGTTSVDGVETHSFINLASSDKTGASMGVKSGLGEIRPYAFSNVVLTDDDAYLGVEQSADTSELGNITLKVYLVNAQYKYITHPKPRRFHGGGLDLYDGAVHETTKKVCDHRVTLGHAMPFGPPPRPGPSRKKLVWEPVDRNDTSPHVIFRFKYRPRAYLRARGIVPTPPLAAPTPQKPICIDIDVPDQEKRKATGQKRKKPLADQSASEQNMIASRTASPMPLFLPSSPENPAARRNLSEKNAIYTGVKQVFHETSCAPINTDSNAATSSKLAIRHRQTAEAQGGSNAAAEGVRRVRPKLELMTPVKVEGMRLRFTTNGVIDLTMDD